MAGLGTIALLSARNNFFAAKILYNPCVLVKKGEQQCLTSHLQRGMTKWSTTAVEILE
jgi:hypothetical protein